MRVFQCVVLGAATKGETASQVFLGTSQASRGEPKSLLDTQRNKINQQRNGVATTKEGAITTSAAQPTPFISRHDKS